MFDSVRKRSDSQVTLFGLSPDHEQVDRVQQGLLAPCRAGSPLFFGKGGIHAAGGSTPIGRGSAPVESVKRSTVPSSGLG